MRTFGSIVALAAAGGLLFSSEGLWVWWSSPLALLALSWLPGFSKAMESLADRLMPNVTVMGSYVASVTLVTIIFLSLNGEVAPLVLGKGEGWGSLAWLLVLMSCAWWIVMAGLILMIAPETPFSRTLRFVVGVSTAALPVAFLGAGLSITNALAPLF